MNEIANAWIYYAKVSFQQVETLCLDGVSSEGLFEYSLHKTTKL